MDTFTLDKTINDLLETINNKKDTLHKEQDSINERLRQLDSEEKKIKSVRFFPLKIMIPAFEKVVSMIEREQICICTTSRYANLPNCLGSYEEGILYKGNVIVRCVSIFFSYGSMLSDSSILDSEYKYLKDFMRGLIFKKIKYAEL